MFKKLFKKDVFSWALYDWANSAFSTSIMAGFFPIFYKTYWNAGVDAAVSTHRLGLTNSIASLVIALSTPFLGALADEAGAKKKLLFCTTFMGAVLTALLAAVGKGDWFNASLMFGFAVYAFSVCVMYYDSLLPSITSDDSVDFISGAGYALGYLGGGVLLLLNVIVFQSPETFGLANKEEAVKAAFISVGVWWFLFALPLFFFVKEPYEKKSKPLSTILLNTCGELASTIRSIFGMKPVLYFMMSYWLYIDGVHTIIKMAVDYGVSIGIQTSDLITALLIVQFVGFPAGFFFGWLGQKWDVKKSILVGISCYIFVVFYAVQIETVTEFFAMATMIGLVQGCVQALSRSLFSRLIPKKRSGEFFGFYNLVGKAASVLGPSLVGIVTLYTGSNRMGISSLLILLVGGGVLLMWKVQNPSRDSENP